MTFDEIRQAVEARFPGAVTSATTGGPEPWALVRVGDWERVAQHLRDDPALAMDCLMCLSGLDTGAPDGDLAVVYHLYSLRHRHRFAAHVQTPRAKPLVPTVSHLWGTANWHEREAYDMYGVRFENHPDMTRILCPEDWEGWPLRKDYQVQDFYHDIPVPYRALPEEHWGGTVVETRRDQGPPGTFRSVRGSSKEPREPASTAEESAS